MSSKFEGERTSNLAVLMLFKVSENDFRQMGKGKVILEKKWR